MSEILSKERLAEMRRCVNKAKAYEHPVRWMEIDTADIDALLDMLDDKDKQLVAATQRAEAAERVLVSVVNLACSCGDGETLQHSFISSYEDAFELLEGRGLIREVGSERYEIVWRALSPAPAKPSKCETCRHTCPPNRGDCGVFSWDAWEPKMDSAQPAQPEGESGEGKHCSNCDLRHDCDKFKPGGEPCDSWGQHHD